MGQGIRNKTGEIIKGLEELKQNIMIGLYGTMY
jgi:hypothetical protein